MRYRRFGNTSLEVSEIGFGGSRLGGVFAGSGRDQAVRLLHQALDQGINFYDTADIYSQGENEALLGHAFRDRRDRVILAGKGGYCLPAQRKLVSRIKPLVKPLVRALGLKREKLSARVSGALSQDFTPDYLIGALEASLRRLKTDYLDIYQLHSPPADVIQRGEFLDVLARMKREGKVRHYGIAADTPEDAALCLALPGISSLQLPFGLLDLEALEAVLPGATRRGLGVIARGCFGGGLLKESLTETELRETTPKWERILAYRDLARRNDRPILEMALQFCLRSDAVSVAILGMRTEEHLAGNLAYYASPLLTDEEYQALLRPMPSS